MKMYIPEIGDGFRLLQDWNFELIEEYRNKSLWDLFKGDEDPGVVRKRAECDVLRDRLHVLERKAGYVYGYQKQNVSAEEYEEMQTLRNTVYDSGFRTTKIDATLPAGSELTIDRIYIRKGASDWSSITFYLQKHPHAVFKKKPRFWVKLADCNRIEFEPA